MKTIIRLLACITAIACVTVAVTRSQSLELKPGYIAGTVTIGSEVINQLYINASWQSQSANSNHSSGNYNITVNVPTGSSPVYTVRPQVYTDSNWDYLYLPTQTVGVAENQTSTLNFNVAPAYVTGLVTVQNGTLSSASISASDINGTWSASTSTTVARGSQFRFPVVAGTVRVSGTVYFTNGTSVSLSSQTLGTVAAGGELVYAVNATAPSTDGAIEGTLSVSGSRVTSLRRVQASGPVSRSATPSVSGAYQIGQLSAGTYNAYAELYYNNNRTYYRSPFGGTLTDSPSFTIAGNTVTRDFNVQQSFIKGTLALTGTRTLAHANYAEVYVNGQSSSTQSGYGQDEVTRPSGEFELIVSPGSWSMNNYQYISFHVPTPGQYLQGQLYIYDYLNAASPIFVAEGDEAVRNLTYETGTVTAVLRSSGVTFGSPRVQMSCSDTVNGQQRTFSFGYFYGNQLNVTAAPVTMVGIKGRCTITTYGRITGSSGETVFGTVTVDVVPGSDLTIDVGGPTLTVTAPTANTAFTSGPISVTGKATDDEQVSSVTVNGIAATLTPTNNPSDPREVSFTASVPLVAGANPISTIATDNTGKTAADSRNVYLDSQDPAVTWTPADGASYPTPGNVTISGNATDNVGISTITVNGGVVYTNPGTPQTSVNFSRVLNLSGGTHQLTVVVKDLGNRTITETRTITVIAPPSTTSVVTSPNPSVSGQQVTLTATVSPGGGATATPTGSMQFLADGNNLGTVLVSNGVASLSTTSLAVGSRAISAVYSGSFIYLTSTGTTTQVVNPISTVTTVTSGTNPSTYNGPSVTFTATVSNVSPGTGTPTGTVQFRMNGLDYGLPVGLSGSATASRPISGMPAGPVTIEAVYTPSSNTRSPSTGAFTQTVNKATPTVFWNTPSNIVYGTLLGPSQLNANASGLPGTFVYSPPAGTKLDAGNGQTLSVIFTPTDAANYNTQTRSVPINVLKATPSVSTSGGIFTYDGAPHGSTGTSSVPGTFSYNYTPGGASAPVNASATPYQVTATFTPTDTANYNGGSATNTITIVKATPTVSWNNPANIVYGTALGGAQLNATASVDGAFTYSPAAHTQLNAGNGQTLSVTFAPTDTGNYNGQTGSVSINVLKASATLSTSGGTFVYDGAPHGSTATSSIAGTFAYTYTPGGSDAPVNASVTPYQVTATFTPSDTTNYSGGTATNTITINRAPSAVSLLGGTYLHDGSPHPAAGSVLGVGNAVIGTPAITYSPNVAAPVAPGIYAAVGSFAGNDNYLPSGATATVVINAAPEVVSVTGPDDPLGLGSAATIDVSFNDDATGDAHTCQFAWNDGTPDTKVILTSTQSACSAAHPYSAAGVYSVGVTVRDDDGYAVGTTFKYVVVFDPSAGFVTGGGWIMSPAGAYANDPDLAGKATFGFVSKYKNGSTVPTGNTEFEFHVGGLRFKSTVYEWLVVAGARAQYKGSGTINGGGDYDFRLTAIDGQASGGGGADKFRITIWDRANDGIVYDNRRGEPDDLTGDPQQIGGGSILIHK